MRSALIAVAKTVSVSSALVVIFRRDCGSDSPGIDTPFILLTISLIVLATALLLFPDVISTTSLMPSASNISAKTQVVRVVTSIDENWIDLSITGFIYHPYLRCSYSIIPDINSLIFLN